jgi:hypothetical protein
LTDIVSQLNRAITNHAKAPKIYSTGSSTSTLRKHLCSKDHVDIWIEACKRFGVEITAKEARPHLNSYLRRKGREPVDEADIHRVPYSYEAFVDAIVEWVVSDDQVSDEMPPHYSSLISFKLQSINMIENPKLRAIFLLLREEMKDSDIPHRTTIQTRILELLKSHFKTLEEDMKVWCFYTFFKFF